MIGEFRRTCLVLLVALVLLGTDTLCGGEVLTVEYGPPTKANTWQEFTIPLTAKKWGATDAKFDAVLAAVKVVRFSFEMHDGPDIGAIDNVSVGGRFAASFTQGSEGWTSGGDGTMSWSENGGMQGGGLTIKDWASGDWHYATAPMAWSGDWRPLKGRNIVFWVRTDQPSVAGRVEIISGDVKRLTLSAKPYRVRPGELSTLTLALGEPAPKDLVIDLDSSSNGVFPKPKSVTIRKGQRQATTTTRAATDVKKGDQSTITATLATYPTRRVTLTVDPDSKVNIKDPVVTAGKTMESVADSHVYAYSYLNWNKQNWGAYNILGVGWNPTGGEKRAYLKFDLTGVDRQKVDKVTLRLYHNHTKGTSLKLGIYRVLGGWIEGRGTYPGKPDVLAKPGEIAWVAQPPLETKPMASFSPGAKMNKHVEVDVTELVKGWLSGKPNHGMAIKAIGPFAQASVYGFYAREEEDKTKRPVLIFYSGGGVATGTGTGTGTETGTGTVTETGTGTGTGSGTGTGTGTGTSAVLDRLRVRADQRQVRPDTLVTVPIWLEFPKVFPRTPGGRINVANLNVEVTYNPAVVKPSSTVIAGNLLGGALFQANSGQPGVIKIGFAGKQGVQTNGTLAQIPFQVIGQPGQQSPLIVRITTVNDSTGKRPPVLAVNGSIRVLPAGVPGDINGNGIVDAGDALAALKMSVDLMKEDLILNVDKQNGVTSNDARLLLKMAVQGNATRPTVGGGVGGVTTRTGPTTTTSNPTGGTTPPIQTPTSVDARRAYQEYIAAYNRMTSLMAKGMGDTPEAKQAYQAYAAAKAKYEAAIKKQPPPARE